MGAKVIQGDCIEEMRKMPAGSVDLIVTSPPYNVDKEYGDEVDDALPYDDYLDWLDEVWAASWHVLCYGGRLCINVNDQGRNPYYPIHADILSRLRQTWYDFEDENRWYLMGNIIWDKMTPMGTTSWGSWEGASSPSLRGRHEYIIVVGKRGKKKQPHIDGAESGPYFNDTGGKEFLELTNEIWRFVPETHSKHPAPFPYELPSRLIRLYSFVGDVILDPFCGSGTTFRAALDFGREAVGIELVEKWANLARERVSQAPMFSGEV